MKTFKVLGIIPARGGSKGVPRKNIRAVAGKPLLAYTAESAISSKLLSRTVLSTDDEEIAEAGRSFGLDVPFMRPAELALDETPTFPVVLHAVRAMEAAGEKFDAVCLLSRPTLLETVMTSMHVSSCLRLAVPIRSSACCRFQIHITQDGFFGARQMGKWNWPAAIQSL